MTVRDIVAEYLRANGAATPKRLELLIASAVRRKSDGKVWLGKRHGEAIHVAYKETGETITREKYTQGFVDGYGTFYNRHEAFKVAQINNQLLNPDEPGAEPTLMSEDLW